MYIGVYIYPQQFWPGSGNFGGARPCPGPPVHEPLERQHHLGRLRPASGVGRSYRRDLNIYVYIHKCIYIYIYTYMHICIYTYFDINVCIYICTHVYTCMYIHVYIPVYVYVYLDIGIEVHFIYIHIYIYIYTYLLNDLDT